MLLEVWCGDAFLGEAPVPRGDGPQRLRLRAFDGAVPGCTRRDRRKAGSLASCGSVHLAVEWRPAVVGRPPLLHFELQRADGLAGTQGECARVLLWLRKPGAEFWQPLWTSREAASGEDGKTSAVWGEAVDLATEDSDAAGACHTFQAPAAGGPAETLRSPPRSPPGVADPSAGRVPAACELRDPHQLVAGAEWTAHWGTSEEDGTMRGSILATQAMQRFGIERANRSLLFMQLASQVEGYRNLQEGWLERVAHAKATMRDHEAELEQKREEAIRVRKEMATLQEEHERRLATACRELCGALDAQHSQERMDDAALEQSKKRISEQRTMVHQLVDKSHALQGSLDRTVRKFDEVSSSYAQIQGDLLRSQVMRPHGDRTTLPEPCTQVEMPYPADLLSRQEQRLQGLKSKLLQLQEDRAEERKLNARLEELVKRIAVGPPARLRTGGGFQLDSTAKSEAAALLIEMGKA